MKSLVLCLLASLSLAAMADTPGKEIECQIEVMKANSQDPGVIAVSPPQRVQNGSANITLGKFSGQIKLERNCPVASESQASQKQEIDPFLGGAPDCTSDDYTVESSLTVNGVKSHASTTLSGLIDLASMDVTYNGEIAYLECQLVEAKPAK